MLFQHDHLAKNIQMTMYVVVKLPLCFLNDGICPQHRGHRVDHMLTPVLGCTR